MKDIYEMGLHDGIKMRQHSIYIIRVPGGWIYEDEAFETAVFVPYNEEFKKKEHSEQ